MQAARGASLTVGRDDGTSPAGSSSYLLTFAAIAAVGYLLDQATKLWAVARLSGSADVEVLGDLLVLRLVRNPGAAFSAGSEFTAAISVVAIVATAVVVWQARKLGSRLWAVGLGLLLAGITGNLTDRLLRDPGPMLGHVIDFLALPNWPVFNVADMCINAGAALVLVQAFRGIRVDGSHEHEHEHEHEDEDMTDRTAGDE